MGWKPEYNPVGCPHEHDGYDPSHIRELHTPEYYVGKGFMYKV